MLLKNKTAVIYGGAGAVGSAVARAFAREGATVFLAGRTLATLDEVVQQIVAARGKAFASQLDAMDQEAVEKHLKEVVQQAGRIDISFNLIGMGDIQGTPLVKMKLEDFVYPVVTAMTSHFYTTTAAIRHMEKNKSGVILTLTANAAREVHADAGGFGVTCAAMEALCRQLAIEAGPSGIRVVCLRSAGSPDAPGVDQVFHKLAANAGVSREAFENGFAQTTMLKRLPKLAEVANVAVLMASDQASPLTAAVINVTCGEMAD